MMIHPNPEQYELRPGPRLFAATRRNTDAEWEWGCGMFIELAFLQDQGSYVGQTVDLRPSLHQFAEVVATWAEKETYNSEFKLKLKAVKRTRLPEYALKARSAKRRVSILSVCRVQVPLLRPEIAAGDQRPVAREAAGANQASAAPMRSDGPPLLDEAWLKVLSFFSAVDLCRVGEAHAKLKSLASDEDTWKSLCQHRWHGKQWMKPGELFRNGDYSGLRLSVAECKSLLQRRGFQIPHVTEKSDLLCALHETNPHVPGARRGMAMIPSKWKRCYVYAEVDSRRQHITEEEVAHFRWQLVYHGRPSSMGLRHFQKNGVFVSPHFGETRWSLLHGGTWFMMQGIDPLKVSRNLDNWGWVIGAETSTEYHSAEVEQHT
ncbi:unnamed protein product [Symbiodinium natans]|uniref:F-box domain-containing protein n=1 Tax=Symbiodinium natans TaxID=878477 RepID=A0A812PAN5_9DINO|nr:unnamed protein product [Symbiodinium natans]